MTTTSIGKLKILLLLAFPVIWGGMYYFFHKNSIAKEKLHLAKEVSVINTIYNSSIELFRLSAKPLVEGVIQNEDVLEIFAKGVNSVGEEQDKARQELFFKLKPAYDQLREQGIVLFHFHTSDIKSFLRFHKPDKYGDSLRDIRPSIEIANTHNRPVEGFEFGRIKSGYRNIFPLNYKDQHLGSVELSVSFDEIRNKMDEIDRYRNYQLILNRDIVFGVLFEQWKEQYPSSLINPGYVIDKSLSIGKYALNGEHQDEKLLSALSINKTVKAQMEGNQAFAVGMLIDKKDWAVTFIPVWDISHSKAGYLVSYEVDPFLTSLRDSFRTAIILGTLFLLVLFAVARMLISATNKLISEKNHLSTINDTIGDGLYVMDEKGIVTHVNAIFTDILGYRPEEIIGKIGHNIFHAHNPNNEALPLGKCPIYLALQDGQIFEGEEHFRHKNGKLILVEVASKSFRYISGKSYSVAAFRDITGRREKEKQIEQEKLRFSSLLKSTQDGYWLIDKAGKLLDVNDSYCNMSGYSAHELIGKRIDDIEVSHSKQQIKENIERVIRTGRDTFDARHRHKNGEEFDVEISVSFAEIEGGLFFALVRDISQRKQNQLKIEQQKKEFEAVFDYSKDGIALSDLEFNLLDFNHAFSEGVGYSRKELLSKSLLDLFIPEDVPDIEKEMKVLFAGGSITDMAKSYYKKDGTVIHAVISAVMLPDNERILLNVKDVTRMKVLEEQLQKLAETDKLTNISNRQKFEFELVKYTELANRMGLSIGLIMFDLDHFKSVNDTYGHDVGDQVLIKVADLVQQHIRLSDIFARWGGEEFMILLPGVDTEHLEDVSEKLRLLIEESDFAPLERLTCSFGTTIYQQGEDSAKLLKRVDVALYEAKNAGRNRVCSK